MTIRELYKQAEQKGFLDVPIANDFMVTINVHVTAWNLDVSASPIAIFETKEKAEEFANYLRSLKGCVIGVGAREETIVTEDGCKTERYLEPALEYDGNFLLD